MEQSEKAKAESANATPAAKKETEEDVFAKGTGVYKSISALIAHFKFKLGNVGRTIRVIVPAMSDLEKHGILEVLYGMPQNILKNLACEVDQAKDGAILGELRKRNFKITDYRGTKLFALNIDTSEAALAVYEPEKNALTGIFSNNEELVKLISQAIMNPFIKGVKLS